MKIIPLTRGKEAKVCDCHYDLVAPFKWFYDPVRNNPNIGYASRRLGSRNITMHKVINNTPPGMVTDHKDGDGLNNQCFNLRNATEQQNGQNRQRLSRRNSSGYQGVYIDDKRTRTTKWRASIAINGKNVTIGRYLTKEEAIAARREAEIRVYGSFAPSVQSSA